MKMMKNSYRKHNQVSLNKWSVWYNGEYRGTVRACDEMKAKSFLPVDKFPERKQIVLVRIVIEE